ncbi:MAG: molybdate ABC transporter permease subunit [Rikenellaceae bacterium]
MDAEFLGTLLLTSKLAICSVAILFVVSLPIAYVLAFKRFFGRAVTEALISMPMVLPPTVLGFYLLMAYNPNSLFGGAWFSMFGQGLAFSFEGILLASVLFGLPFMVQPLQNGFMAIPESLSMAAQTLGKSKLNIFFKILLPNMIPSIVSAIALTFARTIGEFGVIMMVGGNMPSQTRVASIAIYDEVQSLNFETANQYSMILFCVSLIMLTIIQTFNRKDRRRDYAKD